MIKCIAIDDEPLALRQIKSYITRTSSLELVATFSNAPEAADFLAQNEVDLIFTDINMPELNGLEFVRGLNQKTMVIFTTAYPDHAVEGFRLDAVDYLLKPFSLSEFQRSVGKAQSLYELLRLARKQETEPAGQSEVAEALPEGPEFLTIKADYKTTLVRISEILYVESEGEYVRLHMADGSTLMTLFRLKNMHAALPEESFMRIHRSYVVNLRSITSYAKGKVFLSNGDYIPIGDNYRADFQRYAEQHFQMLG